jgi:hypothetical protein
MIWSRAGLAAASLLAVSLAACGDDGGGKSVRAGGDLGVEPAGLSPTISHPYVAFASVERAVYEGTEVDDETGESVALRVESTVRDATTTVAGVDVAIVDVAEYEDGELVERTEDYYAQDRDGTVYYMGERVDDYEDGKVAGHHGQWLAGQKRYRAGVFMPAEPKVGDEFEQERAPGVAEDRSTVVATGATVTVPAGTFGDCIETEDVDPLGGAVEHKFYCRDVGLVQEAFAAGGTLDLVRWRAADRSGRNRLPRRRLGLGPTGR